MPSLRFLPICLWIVGCVGGGSAIAATDSRHTPVAVNPIRQAYFGDLQLHTSNSFDGYIDYGTLIDPDAAYRFARGEVVTYLGKPVRRRQPLDFVAVTDHGESIGIFNQLQDPDSAVSRSDTGKRLRALLEHMRRPDGRSDWRLALRSPPEVVKDFWDFRKYFRGRAAEQPAELKNDYAPAWQRYVDAANLNYRPGSFTTFIGYEWASFGDEKPKVNLHRNVIFRGSAPPYPFTVQDSQKPDDLWSWLETIRKQGYDAFAIPHNSNASNGLMFDGSDSNGRPMDAAYAARRAANEPLSEIAQLKGTSETHPQLSPDDPFADYEILDFLRGPSGRTPGSYLRDALGRGLVLQRRLGVNPYKVGFVGGSDVHSGLSTSAAADFPGGDDGTNLGGGIPTREQAAITLSGKNPIDPGDYSLKMSPGSLTGVWADSNTRESIFDALRRRESFATSGTFMKIRFFGGWSFGDRSLRQRDWVKQAYATGVPMGGDLPVRPAEAGSPCFLVWAIQDPNSASLDRVQIIKVWEQHGEQHEKVFDVVWSGKRQLDSLTGKIAAVENTVDLRSGHYANRVGAKELKAFWRDPSFDPRQLAAYYVRVLEIPTPRWSTLLAIKNELPLPASVPATLQQRGWSSPIWYAGAPDVRVSRSTAYPD